MLADIFPIIGCTNPDVVMVPVHITYDGSGVPTITTGKGYTVTDAGAGLFTITTKFPWRAFLGGGFLMKHALAQGQSCDVVASTASARTVELRVVNDADAAEDPSNGDGVYVMLWFQTGGAMPA